jgi:hypothetical protein
VINLVDHGMRLQEAVEAPRIWTQGFELELEPAFSAALHSALQNRGHPVVPVPNVGGGMNAIEFHDDGSIEGAPAGGQTAHPSVSVADWREKAFVSCRKHGKPEAIEGFALSGRPLFLYGFKTLLIVFSKWD